MLQTSLIVLCIQWILLVVAGASLNEHELAKIAQDGLELFNHGAYHQAAKVYSDAITQFPESSEMRYNMAITEAALGNKEKAVEWLYSALKLPPTPQYATYHFYLACYLEELAEAKNDVSMFALSFKHHAKALQMEPKTSRWWGYAGLNHMAAGQNLVGLRCLQTTMRLGAAADILTLVAYGFERVGKIDAATRAYKLAIQQGENDDRTWCEYFHSLMVVGDWTHYHEYLAKVTKITETMLQNGLSPHVQPFDALAFPFSNELRLKIAARYAQDSQYVNQRTKFRAFSSWISAVSPHRERRLHLGYMSSDWTDRSAVGRAILGGIKYHTKTAVLVTCYTLMNRKATGTRNVKLEESVERVVPLEHLNNYEAAKRINDDGVQVLVNLNGYTGTPRTEIYALTPAPVQILQQGFAGTSGASYIQYAVGDHVQTPPEFESYYSEKLILLSLTGFMGEGSGTEELMTDDERRRARASLGLPVDTPLLANFNRFFKIEPVIFDRWMQILNETEKSHLWLFKWDGNSTVGHIKKRAGNLRNRVHFTGLLPLEQRVTGKTLADLFLDTPGYNAHGTATEVLFGLVPTITLAGGGAHAARVCASVVMAAGVPELVVRNLDDYVALTKRIVSYPSILKKLRKKLLNVRYSSPLYDKRRWTVHLENSFIQSWEMYVQGVNSHHLISPSWSPRISWQIAQSITNKPQNK